MVWVIGECWQTFKEDIKLVLYTYSKKIKEK